VEKFKEDEKRLAALLCCRRCMAMSSQLISAPRVIVLIKSMLVLTVKAT